MIWSIVPEELIFAGQTAEQALTVINYLGKSVAVRQGRIEALLSSNPNDYLDTRFMPGALVDSK